LQTEFNRRQYMLEKDFELYYYIDTKLDPVKMHKHDCYEFYFFMKGDIEISINEIRYRVNSGDIILLLPDTNHYPLFLSLKMPRRIFVLWISVDYCNNLIKQSVEYGYLMQYVIIHKE